MLAQRLAAQGLAGRAAGPVEATRRLLAVQAQDPRGMRLAMRARGARRGALEAALDERALLVTWVNRGTLHLIAAEDEPLLHLLTTPQLRTANERRLRQEGVSDAAASRGVRALAKALSDGPLPRAQARAVLERAGVPVAGQAFTHVLFRATLDGLILRGGGELSFVLASDWLGERPRLDRDAALAELARRYLAGHGPASDRDLARWAQILLRDARRGLRAVAPVERPDGLLELPGRRRTPPLPAPRLLGPFDPLLLGWCSREFLGACEVVTSNGIVKAVALVDGQITGTWTAPGGRVELALWDERGREQLARDAQAVERFL